jgi:hypothetical protein
MASERDERRVWQLKQAGASQREIERQTGIPRTTVQRILQRPRIPEVYQGGPHESSPQVPAVTSEPAPLTTLDSIKTDLLELVDWWRARKMRRVDSGTPRETQRWTVHVDKRWIDVVKVAADVEGVSQAEIVDRAFRQYFEGR